MLRWVIAPRNDLQMLIDDFLLQPMLRCASLLASRHQSMPNRPVPWCVQVITISLTGATAVFIGIILYCRWKRLMCY